MKLLFLHGWGFDDAFWDPLAALLPDWPHLRDDRGYFGAPRTPDISGPVIAVAHSFGAMRLLADPPPGCRGLVAINGFERFTARGEHPGVAPRVVARMMARFRADPPAVIGEFARRCGADAAPKSCVNPPLLQDLQALLEGDCSAQIRGFAAPVLSLQGGCDPILPAPMRAAVFRGARRVRRVTRPAAGHLLPHTDPAYCAEAIRAFAERQA